MMIAERQDATPQDGDDDGAAAAAYEEMRRVLKDIEDALRRVRILARRMKLANDGGQTSH